MTSKERVCAAMRGAEVDYLPCSIYFNSNLVVDKYDCSGLIDKSELALELGVDPFLLLGMPMGMHPAVKIRNWEEQSAGETYPILWQSWDTPAGRLTQAVRKDLPCQNWRSIHWGDESASSLFKPLIENREDIERCHYLFQPATEAQYSEWLHKNESVFAYAAHKQLPVIATYGQGLAAIMFLIGAERAVYLSVDDPTGFEKLAEMIHRCEMRNIELAARGHVDILKRFGGYEMCNFYNPEIFQRVCLPRLKKEVEYAHSLGLLIYYRIVTGMEPLLDTIAEIGFDCIEGGEPHLSRCSLEMWRDAFARRASSWTGVSTPILLGGNDPEAVRQEVRHCVDVFGKDGYILGITNSIRQHFPWQNSLALVDEWHKIR